MSSPEEMQSQSGKHAADATDDDIVVVDEETAIKEPGCGPWMPDRESSSAPAAPTEPGQAGPSASRDDRRWREIQGMFVDDPRDSVQRASDLIDTAIEEFLATVRQQQVALASSWQNRDADTEVLRVALKDYRALWAVVRDMPAIGATGAAAASAGAGGSSFGAGPGGPAGQQEPGRGRTPA